MNMMAMPEDYLSADHARPTLDLNQLCVQHPTATYFVRASGDAMIDAGIQCDDVLVVDRSLQARDGDIVVANVDHSFMVRKLQLSPLALVCMNQADTDYQTQEIDPDSSFDIFGVVTFVVHAIR